jgi:anti-sigma B factor antagonist
MATEEVATTWAGTATVVSVSGTLDMATADRFEEAVIAALEKGQSVLVDVSGVALCDSTGLGAMVRMHRRAMGMRQRFGIRNPRPNIADLLAMTGIDKVIPVLSSRD